MVNGIHKTKIVSFPRSGCHLLVRGLQILLQDELVFSEFYGVEHNMENSPCVNLQKSHDFNLTDEIDPNMKYIVLHRNPLQAVESWYIQVMESGHYYDWELFKAEKMSFAVDFYEKWNNITNENFFVLPYETLINHLDSIESVADFISEVDYDHRKIYFDAWCDSEHALQTKIHAIKKKKRQELFA